MIGVLGATGRIGGLVAQRLADSGAPACALVRRHVDGLPLPAIHADLRDVGSLDAALRKVERLLLVTPHGPDQDLLEQAAIGAAYRAGVERIVKVSGGAASLGPNGPTPTGVAHWRSERLIEETGLGFTFLRPSFFMQNLVERFATPVASLGVFPSPLGSAPIAMVDARDVADCAARALTSAGPDQRAWQLTGPTALRIADIAEQLGIRHVAIPTAVAAGALRKRGASTFEITHATRMAALLASGSDSAVTDHVAQLTGHSPRSVDAFLDAHASAFAPATPAAKLITHLTGG